MLSKKSKTTTEKKKKEAEGAAAELAPPAAVPLALLEENTSAEEALSSVFDISPRKVIILQFEPSATYEAKLTFKNRTKVNQFLRVAQPASQHFSVSAPKGSESTLKVAPGLAVSYKIVFSAPEAVNLTTELNVKTETEEFTIPVLAFSKQATLALPPQVVMEDCPVKVTTEKSLFLKNNDAQPCTWRAVFTDAEMPSLCSLSPNFGTVAPSEVQPVVIRFNPAQVRPYNGTIRFLLGPEGDLVQDLPLQCNVSELPIALDTTQAVFDDTYVTTEQRREVVLKNTSDTRLDFCWRSSFQTGNDPTEGGPTVFDDEVFSIEPVRGEIYGRGEKHFTITFSPQNAIQSEAIAYLDITGRSNPLPLKLSGVGVGPQCELEFDKLNIKDVYMNAVHEYEVELSNVGSIEARFTVLEADTLMGQKFTFTPSTGTLQPGDSTVLKIELKSDLIGVLNETFRIHLHGSLDELTLQFKGRIVGPSFQFNVDELDFGNVSFNFWHQRPFNISNTGQVPMIYNLRLAPDGGREEEFTIKPSKGVIPPMESESIVLEYLSNTAGELETALLVDIEDVGEAVDSIPIKAACMVAPLTLTQNRLGYGNCFIDYEYCLNVEVVNDTALSGKFQLDVVDKKGIEKVAKVTIGEPDQQTPIVILDPHSKVQVPVSLRVLAVGDLTFSLALHVLGEEGPSQTVLINAVGCGPNVDVHPTALNFGAVEVLQSEEKTLTLHNTSPIPASFKVVLAKMQEKMASTKGEPKNAWDLDSIFRVEPEAAVIEPFGEMTLKVIATADEAMTFTENLVLDIQYAEESVEPIQLKANGKGFPLRAEEDITAINLGDVFTDTPVSREVVIHNKGRKEQEVQWQNSRGAKVKEGAPPIVFNYKPERCIIRPRESYTFVVEGYIKQVGTFSDEFTLKQSGTFKEILRSTVSANFLEPLLLCSTRHIPFEYVEQVVTDATPNTNSCPNTKLQSFTVKNTTPKDLEVVLKIMKNKSKTPFSFEGPSRFNLASGETQVVGVAFDPHYLGDYTSHTVKNQIQMSFTNHSRTETITLSAKIAFPSLLMEPAEEINFGTIVKDTEAHQELLLINPSPNIPAVFQWEMLDANGEPSTTNEAIRLFDFAPFHGVIPPGGTQKVQATFYGTAGKHASKARCTLQGGRPYTIDLRGSAGDVNILYDKTVLDFGVLQFYEQVTQTLTISNPSHVAVNFSVDTLGVKTPGRISVSPMSGKITEKAEIKVTFCPQVPDEVHEFFSVQVGHFDPQRIDVVGRGQVNSLGVRGADDVAAVSRWTDPTFNEALSALKKQQQEKGSAVPLYATKISEDELPSVPKHIDLLEAEAERRSFCQALLAWQESTIPKDAQVTPPLPVKVDNKKGSSVSRSRSTERSHVEEDLPSEPLRHVMRRMSTSSQGTTKFVLSRYVVDFGHMTLNDVKTTKLNLINTSGDPLFLMIDSKEVGRLPLQVNPLKITQLPPLSEVDFSITLDARPPQEGDKNGHNNTVANNNTKRKTLSAENAPIPIEFGENNFEFAIDVKGGPAILIQVHCFVATPALSLGTSTLDFGKVLLGQVKVLPLTLTNEQTVACEWRLTWVKKGKESGKSKTIRGIPTGYQPASKRPEDDLVEEDPLDAVFPFWVNQERGVLEACKTTVVEVFFSPIKAQDYAPTLRFKFVNNSKAQDIVCKGSARLYDVVLHPDGKLSYPVVRPFQVAHEKIKITNNEDEPIELYSSNLDVTVAEEIRILRRALGATPDGQLFLPTRGAGDLLPDDLLESVYGELNQLQEGLEFIPPKGFFTKPEGTEAPPSAASTKRRPSAKTKSARVSIESAVPPQDVEPPRKPPTFILFIGAPQSGKTLFSSTLTKLKEFEAVSFEDLVNAAALSNTVEGDLLRSALSVINAKRPAAEPEKGPKLQLPNQHQDPYLTPEMVEVFGDATAAATKENKAPPQSPFAPVPVNPALVSEDDGRSVREDRSRRTSAPSSRSGSRSGLNAPTTSNISGGEDMVPVSRVDPKLLAKMVQTLLQNYVEEQIKRHGDNNPLTGFVMDDLCCPILYNRLDLFKVVRQVCEATSCPLKVVNLAVTETTVGLRFARLEQAFWQKKVQDAHVDTLEEDAYAELSAPEREVYNIRLKYYSDCKRELQRISKSVGDYEALSAKEAEVVSIQREIEQRREAQLNSDEGKGNKKNNKNAEMKTDMKPKSGPISPLDAFKEFYESLLGYADDEASGAPPPSRAQGSPPTVRSFLQLVENESTVDVALQSILTSTLPAEGVPSLADLQEEGTSHSKSSSSRPVTFAEPSSMSENSPSQSDSRVGTWVFLDSIRLAMLKAQEEKFVRFFSEVEREVSVVAKGKASGKQAPKTSNTVKSICEVTRWLIPPKSSVHVTVEFCCDRDGLHTCQSLFGVVGTLQSLPLVIEAQAALPDITRDERSIFPHIRPRLTAGKNPSKAFLMAKRMYDFGPLLVPVPANAKRRKSKDERSTSLVAPTPVSPAAEPKEVLTFSNPGVSDAEITLTFQRDKDTTFTVSPSRFTLTAGATQDVALEAHPTEVGDFTNVLVAVVKSNPDPWYVNVRCTGTRPGITFDNEAKSCEVDLDRTVVNRPVERTITLFNTSSLPVQWELSGLDKLPEEIRLSDVSGVIEEFGVHPITIQFCPTTTCLHAIALQLLVSSSGGQSVVYESLPLTIKAEGHDVVLEWTKEIDYGLVHVGDVKTEVLRVMNKSPYDVAYQIRIPKKLQSMLTVSPQVGTIRGLLGHKEAAIVNVEVTVTFSKEGELPKRTSMLEVAFLQPEARELLYPLQLIPVIGEAWFTKFTIKPSSGVDFGSCFFNQKKQRTFEIQNAGLFPVAFHLFDYNLGHESVTEGNLVASDAAAKKGKSKNADTEIRVGCFCAYPCREVIPVGGAVTVTVDALLPDNKCQNRETLGVFVEQSALPDENRGVALELAAHPATPGIASDLSNTGDVESIFEEQQVVYRLDQFDRGTRAYGKEDRTFSYGAVLVGQGEKERFRISNSSPLPTTVTVQLLSNAAAASAKGTKQQTASVDGFEFVAEADTPLTANSGKFVLPPFESKFITIRFTPSALQRYEAHFVANVEGGSDSKTNSLSFQIIGEGTLPNVEYTIPPRLRSEPSAGEMDVAANGGDSLRDASPSSSAAKAKGKKRGTSQTSVVDVAVVENNVIEVPLTLVGETSKRSFSVRNTGTITAYVRLAVLSDEEESHGLHVSNQNEDVSILPGTEEVFEVTFSPSEIGKFSMRLYATLLHNPFVDRELTVVGQSFSQPISFENIDPSLADYLNAGYCYVNDESTHTFKLRNNSASDVRYEWNNENTAKYSMEWIPAIGHLGAGASKDITLKLRSKEISPHRVTLQGKVKIQSIELPDEAVWDSSIVDQRWVVVTDGDQQRAYGAGGRRNLKKVMEPVAEPNHQVTEDLALTQVLRVSYLCDTPAYTMGMVNAEEGGIISDFERIVFPTTKLFQKRIVTLRLTNTGKVALPYHFHVEEAATGFASKSGAEGEEEESAPAGNDFSIEPEEKGTVEVGETKDIRVVFSPFTSGEVVPRVLLCEFPHSAEPNRRIQLVGSGECPLIHIQVPPSDYLSLRVDGEAGPQVDPNSLVLNFFTRGLHSQSTMRFHVLNPTDSSYPFEWSEESLGSLSPFRCLTPSGVVAAGKYTEMAFEYTGETLGVRERVWSLVIPGKNASIPFLLVGRTADPSVFLSESKVHFGNINLGGRAEKVVWMENLDDVPFNFTFNKAELKVMSTFLSVRPSSGSIGPKEKLPLTVTFTPQDEMEYNIPLSCNVKKASIPLTLNVKGTGGCVHDALVMEPFPGHPNAVPVQKDNLLIINLGRVQIDERVTRSFILSNTGQSSFDYTVVIPERRFVSIENGAGSILPKERSVITLVYNPATEESLRQFRMQFKISGKLSYQIGVQATTYVPKLQLSYDKYDFGPRFIKSANPVGAEISTVLSMYNQDKEEVTVECSLSEGNEWCELDQTSLIVLPNDRRELKITFHPNDVRVYSDKLKLLLNGSYPMMVPLSGEGVQPRVEVTNQFAKFGVARVGEKRVVEVRMECKSRIPTPISFMGCVTDDLSEKGVALVTSPQSFIMKPKEHRMISLSYQPMRRMGEFQREMKMLICGREFPFAMLSGSCQDAETQLDTTVVQFNDVVVGASSSKRVMVMNSGDLPQKFSWVGLSSNEVQVNPASGFMRAHTELSCEFTYRPASATSSINQRITLQLERAPDIHLQLEASSVSRPPAKETVKFRCRARQVDTQKITVDNPSSEAWTFTPVLDSLLWTVPHSVTIKPKSKGEVEVQYAPMRETKGGKCDKASLFIPQDNGKGLTYALEGTSDEAGPSAPLRELNATTRETHTVNFNVSNWSTSPTRFTRTVEWTSPANVDDGLVTVKGPSTVDVQSGATTDCSLTLNFVREGQYRGVVHFKSTSNSDVNQYFELLVRVTTAAASATSAALVEIRTPVRQRALYNIPIGNPLTKPITVACKLDGPADVLSTLTVPASLTVPAKNALNAVVEFLPLLHREYPPVKLSLSCPDVDLSVYSLKLISTPPVAERLTRLSCPLGQSVTFTLRYTHFAKVNAEYSIKIGGETSAAPNTNPKNAAPPIFTRAANQAATIKVATTNPPKEQEVAVDFLYEPRELGNTKESIEIASVAGGVYTFPILATCVPPQPQGPYLFKAGQSVQVPFKNVFSDAVTVQIQTDSPVFVVSKKTENVAAKKSINIAVQCKMDSSANVNEVFFSKLLVTCIPPGESKQVEWVYYLEGTKDGKKK